MTTIDTNYRVSAQARAILALVADYEFEVEGSEIIASPLYNGRERGICLEVRRDLYSDVSSMFINFGECRASDAIFVETQHGPHEINPSTLSDRPDRVYDDEREMFDYDHTGKTAVHILKLIRRYIGEATE